MIFTLSKKITKKYLLKIISSRKLFTETIFLHKFAPLNNLNYEAQKSKLFCFHQNRFFSNQILKVPFMGDSISEGKVIEYQKKKGDFVKVDDIIAIIETDKTTIDIRATESGIIKRIIANVDDTVQVDSDLVEIDTKQSKPVIKKETKQEEIKEDNLKSKQDLKINQEINKQKDKSANKEKEKSKISFTEYNNLREERVVSLSRMRLKIATRLKEAQNTAAMLTTFNEINCDNIIKIRKKYKDAFLKTHGIKLGFMSTFIKASTKALQAFPEINAYFDLSNKSIIYHNYVDVSVAIASKNGLIVPVIRDTHLKSFSDIEKQIKEFSDKAAEGKIKISDMVGGTFTVSNSGVFKSLIGTPIINPPQSAVLGMYGIFETPVAINGEVMIKPIMKIALTYDHRIVDGREAALFLKKIKEYVEDPISLLLDL